MRTAGSPSARLPAAAPCCRAPRRHHAAAPALLAAAACGAAPASARAEVLGSHGESRSGPCARCGEQVILEEVAPPPWRGLGRWDPGGYVVCQPGWTASGCGGLLGSYRCGWAGVGVRCPPRGWAAPARRQGLRTPAPLCGLSEADPPGTWYPLTADPPALHACARWAKGLQVVGPAQGPQVSPDFPRDPP